VVVPAKRLPEVVAAMRAAHSYEEPAFDLYPLAGKPVAGIGRVGKLAQPTTLSKLARKLATTTRADGVQIVGRPAQRLTHVVTVAGAAGSLPFKTNLTPAHAIVTGEIRHHDAFTIARIGCAAIALGHWSSERPVLASVAKGLNLRLSIATRISAADTSPLRGS
jgi:putative NIF3 family GTP cyclohydrolase 1 type 2